MIVYLAGPLNGLTDVEEEEEESWRSLAAAKLAVVKHSSYDPGAAWHYAQIADASGIMSTDLEALRRSQAVLLHWHPKSIGAFIETGVAIERGIPVFAFGEYLKREDRTAFAAPLFYGCLAADMNTALSALIMYFHERTANAFR